MIRRLVRPVLRPAARLVGALVAPRCPVCGDRAFVGPGASLPPALVAAWELDPATARDFGRREYGRCLACGSPRRSRMLARALVEFGRSRGAAASSLAALVRDPAFRGLDAAEVNAAGSLHPYLAELPGLRYSEFGGRPGVPHEDLTRLSYPDASLDLVITSETLEHVPDVDAALADIRRVLRPGGAHVFTTPVVPGRETRHRASVEGGRVVHHLPPSYHGGGAAWETGDDILVYWEFGGDFARRVELAGFAVRTVPGTSPVDFAFIATRR